MIIKNLEIVLNSFLPGDEYMPRFSEAVKIKSIFNKLKKNKKFVKILKNKKLLFSKDNLKLLEIILEKEMIETYFTSNLVIKALNLRRRKLLKKKKINLFKLIKKVNKKKIYIK